MSKKSYSLKKIVVKEETNKYLDIEKEELIKDDELKKQVDEQKKQEEEQQKLEDELYEKNRVIAMQRLKEKLSNARNIRTGKAHLNKPTYSSNPQQNAIQQLMKHPSLANLNMNDEGSIKQVIEQMASKMTNDGKQKKQMKKKMNEMLNKMKTDNNANNTDNNPNNN
jgi:hypothetical protein